MSRRVSNNRSSRRWQDVRARAIDATFDADRRRVGERVAVVFRWLFLIVLAVLNNVNPHTSGEAKVTVDVVLVGWAAMNVAVNVLLARGYSPGKQFSLSTMVLDIIFSAGLVYLSDGFSSPFFLALFLAVITNAVRFGATASFLSALVISMIYLFIGGSFTPANFYVDPNATIGKVFLFLVVALTTGYMTRELERERRSAVEHAAQADSLRELSRNLVTETDIKDVFDVLIGHAVQMTIAERGRVILSSQEGFTVVAGTNRDGTAHVAPEGEVIDEHALSQAAGTGEAVFAADHRTLSVPIASADGVTVLVCLTTATTFTNQDLFAVDALSGSSAVPIANALRFQRSRQEASTDGLTGLSNAREFRRRLELSFGRPDRSETPLALLLIDFDHFQSVNDQLGHQHGDLVLQLGARIVRAAARAQDMVARYGGDEIAVMVADTNGAGAQRLAYRIVDAVHAAAVPTVPGEHLTFSIGVASYPEDALTAIELVAAADQALYLAKREGKDRACTFPQLVTELELADSNLASMLAEAGPQVMVAVAHAVDHRNPVAQGHSSRMATIAEAIGRRLGMSPDGLENLRASSFLHDVGHMGLKVGSEDFEAPGHAEQGAVIVGGAHFAPGIAEAVRHHHARWDGTGNSEWLAGETIPGMARVLAVAERFEALTAGRGCPRVAPKAAAESLAAGAGTEFDPAVVDALSRAIRDGSFELNLPDLALPAAVFTPARTLEPAVP
ncbi:MAG TPA: diguanylate cyclase [Candidatus Dormibacteraeota bacterium]|nr:diguanylate cyclase [Candidatus Dormibacteraeota bacterium]